MIDFLKENPALPISVLALFISFASYRRSGRTQRRVWRMEIRKLSEEIRTFLEGGEAQIDNSQGQWHNLLASTQQFLSGFKIKLDQEHVSKKELVREMRAAFDSQPSKINWLSDGELEETISALGDLNSRCTKLDQWIKSQDQLRDKYRSSRPTHRIPPQ